MDIAVHAGVLIPVLAALVAAYGFGRYKQTTSIPAPPSGSPMDNAPADCKAACQRWQQSQMARNIADRAVQAAKILFDIAKINSDKAFWLMVAALALYISASVNPVLAGYVFHFYILYLAANLNYIFCLGQMDTQRKDLTDRVRDAQNAAIAENADRWTVITTCNADEADDCLSHPQISSAM